MAELTEVTGLSKSKSQIKRDMTDLKKLGERLLELKDDQLQGLNDGRLLEAIAEARKIRKVNARKRHLQFIGKLMRDTDLEAVITLLDQHDNQSRQSTIIQHKIEKWRESLLEGNDDVLGEIYTQCPELDHQHLRQLTRLAIREAASQKGDMTHSRKLFRYLREIVTASL